MIFLPSNFRIAAAPSDCRFAAHDGCSASAAAGAPPLAVARSYTDDRAAILFVRVGFPIEGGDFSRLLCKPRCRKCGDDAECDECQSIDLPKMLADAFTKYIQRDLFIQYMARVYQANLDQFSSSSAQKLLTLRPDG